MPLFLSSKSLAQLSPTAFVLNLYHDVVHSQGQFRSMFLYLVKEQKTWLIKSAFFNFIPFFSSNLAMLIIPPTQLQLPLSLVMLLLM